MPPILALTSVPEVWDDPILTRAQAEAFLSRPRHTLLAVGETGQHGHLLLSHAPEMAADILTLYVPPVARRCGHARALVEAALTLARRSGCPSLTLEVNAENAPAVALYSVCGLQQVGKRAGYYTNPVSNLKADALVLAVSLT